MKKWLYSVCAAAIMLGAAGAYAQEKKPVPPAEGPRHEQRMEQMENKLAQELGLTAEQQAQARKIHQEGRKKVKPLMDEMKDIRKKMDDLRQENMKEFEAILTPEQKAKFEKIKTERHEKWKKIKDKMKKGKKMHKGPRPHPEHAGDFPPPPPAPDDMPLPPPED